MRWLHYQIGHELRLYGIFSYDIVFQVMYCVVWCIAVDIYVKHAFLIIIMD